MIGPGRIKGTDRNAWAVVHAIDLLDAEAVHQPVLDHRGRARAALFRRLEDHDRLAGKIARLGEIARGAEQHRGVTVVAAGMHLAGGLRSIGQIGGFRDRQRVHVGAQADHVDPAAPALLPALDDADHTGLAEAGRDLITAEFPQTIRDECCGAVHIIKQFRMRMDVPAPSLNFRLQVGDTVHDGHGNLGCSFSRLRPVLARKICSTYRSKDREGWACGGPSRLTKTVAKARRRQGSA